MNKSNRGMHEKKEPGEVVELENQFILRMPEEPARLLREAIRSGVTSLKDRFTIQLENDMRYGEVRVDHYLMHAKIVDLPTIVESLKTIDNKSFYKTADICQMMICKEEPDIPSTDDESPSKNKKKDPNKVDKKFLWPHGITPPTKNVRRRRFRKTLKKKYVEAPEIEKEVKRLLREDNDAVSVKWEIISEDDDQIKQENAGTSSTSELDSLTKDLKTPMKTKSRVSSNVTTPKHSNIGGTSRGFGSPDESTPRLDLVEHDIFGGAVSDSEEEDTNINIDLDENSQLSADDTTMNDSSHSLPVIATESEEKLITSFSSEMFLSSSNSSAKIDSLSQPGPSNDSGRSSPSRRSDSKFMSSNPFGDKTFSSSDMKELTDTIINQEVSQNALLIRVDELRAQLEELSHQRIQKQREVENMENAALRQRFQAMLQSLDAQIQMKENEYENLQSMLN